MNDQLASGAAQDAGHSVYHEQDAGVPHLNGVGQKQNTPEQRHARIHNMRSLNHTPAIVPVCESAEINRKK